MTHATMAVPMLTVWRAVGLAGVTAGIGVGCWSVLPPPRGLSWWRPRQTWRDHYRRGLLWLWQRVTLEPARERAGILGLTPWQILGLILVVAGGGALWLSLLFGLPWPITLAAASGAVVLLPNALITRRYARWQRRVVAGLPPFLHHMQILLDLGLPLVTAMRRARARVRGPLGTELDRVIAYLERGGTVETAFLRMAGRVRMMEVMVLASTLSASAGRRLTGQALSPLLTMLAAVQQREQERQTSSADQIASAVPILATFGAMITGLYLLLTQVVGGSLAGLF